MGRGKLLILVYERRNVMRIILTVGAAVLGIAVAAAGQAFELIRYGDFENWVTRNITESKIIGGDTKQVYEIAPNATVNGDAVYKDRKSVV